MNLSFFSGGSRSGLQKETRDWIKRLSTPLPRRNRLALDLFVQMTKALGALQLMDVVTLDAVAQTLSDAEQNFKGAAYSLTSYGGVTHTPGVGVTGDGSTGWQDPDLDLSASPDLNFRPEAHTFGCFPLSDISSTGIAMGCGPAGSVLYLRPNLNMNLGVISCGAIAANFRVTSGDGFISITRISLTQIRANKSGSISILNNTLGTSPTPGALGFFRQGTTGVISDANTYAARWIGGRMSEAQEAGWRDALVIMLTTIGTISGDEQKEAEVIGPNEITKASVFQLPEGMFYGEQTTPPANDDVTEATFGGFPANRYLSMQIDKIVACTASYVKCSHWIWGSSQINGWKKRANLIEQPFTHPVSGRACRSIFTSTAKACANDAVKTMFSCGYTQAEWEARAAEAGFAPSDIYTRAQAIAAIDTLFEQIGPLYYPDLYATDIIVLPTARICDAPTGEAIIYDAENQDDRTDQEQIDNILELISICHAKTILATGEPIKFYLYSNPFNAPTQIHTRFNSTTLPVIHDAGCDLIFITIWSRGKNYPDVEANFDEQLAMLGPNLDLSRVGVTFELGTPGTTVNDAVKVRDLMRERGITALQCWRNQAQEGGANTRPTQQKRLKLGWLA